MFRASLLAPLNIRWQGEPPELFLTDAEKKRAAGYLAGHALAPGNFITESIKLRLEEMMSVLSVMEAEANLIRRKHAQCAMVLDKKGRLETQS